MGPIQNLLRSSTRVGSVKHKFFLYGQNTVYGRAKTATLRVYGQLETGSRTQTLVSRVREHSGVGCDKLKRLTMEVFSTLEPVFDGSFIRLPTSRELLCPGTFVFFMGNKDKKQLGRRCKSFNKTLFSTKR